MSDLVGNPEDRFSRVEAHNDSSDIVDMSPKHIPLVVLKVFIQDSFSNKSMPDLCMSRVAR